MDDLLRQMGMAGCNAWSGHPAAAQQWQLDRLQLQSMAAQQDMNAFMRNLVDSNLQNGRYLAYL